MKRIIHFLAVFVIGFSLIFGARALAEEPVKSPWPSSLASTQWYWFVPDFDYSVEKIEIQLKTVKGPVLMNSSKVNFVRGPGYIKIIYKKTMSGKIPTAIELIEPGRSHKIPSLKDFFDNNTLTLYYSYGFDRWFLRLVKPGGDYFDFHFSNEEYARIFGSILASSCKLAGFTLQIPKMDFAVGNLTPAQAEAMGKTKLENVLVTMVALDGSAEKNGIKISDVITEVNGVWVRNVSHFNTLIEAAEPGSIFELTCLERVETVVNGQKNTAWKSKKVEYTLLKFESEVLYD